MSQGALPAEAGTRISPLEDRVQSREFARLAGERLREMLAELVDPAVPFRRTEDEHTCSYCDFKMICGR